jgi:hypothetical protein
MSQQASSYLHKYMSSKKSKENKLSNKRYRFHKGVQNALVFSRKQTILSSR